MTADEYAKLIGARLRNGHNSKSQTDVQTTLREADATLASSNLSSADKTEFWEDVRKAFYDGSFLVEKQDNSALHALMQSILSAIAAREQAGE